MLEMHLREPGFICSACRPFIKNEGRIQNSKISGYSPCIYQKELDKTCLQPGVAYCGHKDLPRITANKAWFQPDMAYGAYKDLPQE